MPLRNCSLTHSLSAGDPLYNYVNSTCLTHATGQPPTSASVVVRVCTRITTSKVGNASPQHSCTSRSPAPVPPAATAFQRRAVRPDVVGRQAALSATTTVWTTTTSRTHSATTTTASVARATSSSPLREPAAACGVPRAPAPTRPTRQKPYHFCSRYGPQYIHRRRDPA